MKNFFLCLFLIFPLVINSQSAGDIAFIQYNADNSDNFAFVCLVDFNSGDKIYFTENEPGDIEGGEWECEWFVNSTIDKGTIITISNSDSDGTLGNATIDIKGSLGLSSSGDGIWAYTGSDFGQTTTWIAAIGNNGSSNTWDSTEGLISSTTLINGTNAVALTEIDNAKYDGSTTTGTKDNLLSAINDYNNWIGSNSTNQTFSGTFNVTSSVSPEPTNHPTGLSASATHEKITLTWTDAATGSQAPSKYLIIGEKDSSIADPVDTTAIADDSDASDNRVSININHGVGTTSFSNLGVSAQWYFEIFPYTNSGSTINFKTDGTVQTGNATTTNAIQITEIVYNNPDTADWEWVELYNPTASAIDISGYTIVDNGPNILATFPGSTSISATSYFTVVVYGDGTAQFSADYDPGSGNYNGALNNGGDSVILKDASGNIVDQVDYDDVSPWPTDPDGSFKSLELIDGNNNYYAASWQASYAEYGSPGAKTSTAWNTSLGSGDNLTIDSPDNIVITGDEQINIITINSGASLTIEKTGSLTVGGNFTNNGTVKLQSDSNEFAAIKVTGTPTGNITYKRYVNTVGSNEWDLIGSPVGGNNYISSFITANSGRLATNGSSPTAYAVGYYDNSGDSWTNYNSSSVVNNSTAFGPGKGYQMAHVSGGVLDFTGTIPSTTVSESVVNNSASGRRWNLVANPFPSFINANDDADATNNFIDINTTPIDDENYLFVYGYDADGTGYTPYGENYNNNDTAVYIAPGQGFFIAAESSVSSDVSFTTAMQTINGADDFITGDTSSDYGNQIQIRLYKQNLMIEDAHIYFNDDVTAELDPGRDAGDLNQSAGLMSRLVENDQGVGFAIQELPTEIMNNCIIPLEVNTYANEEFKINLHMSTLEGVYVYLEDTEEGTMTNLLEGDFVLTPTSDLEGVGRFFIHMTADTMSNEEVSTSMLNVYKETGASYITVEGLATQSNETKVSLHNVLGREVLSTSLNNNIGTQTISTVGLSAGIYVIGLESGSDRLTKKILIQ